MTVEADVEVTRYKQATQFSSPHTFGKKVRMLLWETTWAVLCAWTPKPFSPWRLLVLRWFGCRIDGRPFVHGRARIQMPWNLILHHKACLGDRANAYSTGPIEIGARAVVAQEAYLCAGTHDFSDPALSLVTMKITIGEDAFLGARVFVLPGVEIGAGAVIGAASVVTKNMPAWMICAGNPCKPLRRRERNNAS